MTDPAVMILQRVMVYFIPASLPLQWNGLIKTQQTALVNTFFIPLKEEHIKNSSDC